MAFSVVAATLLGIQAASPAVSATSIKPLLTGLMSRDGPPSADLSSVIHNYVVQVNWSTLQPTDSQSLDTTELDADLQQAADAGVRVRLRIFAGAKSPDWAKQLGGAPMTIVDTYDGKTGTVPRYWTADFGAAYDNLQALLAARYDSNPTVAEVVMSRCTAFYPEPFLRQTQLDANRQALLAAGFTLDADHTCEQQMVDAQTVWTTTRSSLSFNPYQALAPDGTTSVDDDFTASMMTYCRSQLGQRCVLTNDSVRSPITSLDHNPAKPYYGSMYDAMTAAGPPLAFQTAVEAQIGDCGGALTWAVAMHATTVELPRDPTAAGCTADALAQAAALLGRPTAPTSVTAVAGTKGKATVSWQPPVSDCGTKIGAYRVFRAVGGRKPTKIAQLTGTARQYLDTSAPRNATVVYSVLASSGAGGGPAAAAPAITTN